MWLSVYRLLLTLYPRSVRELDGLEMQRLFTDLVDDARSRGRAAGVAAAVRICLETPRSAWRARRSAPRQASGGGASWIDDLALDLRFACRTLRKTPRFTSLAVLTLVVGIGATTAVFSLVHATLFRPLPFPSPEQLVTLHLSSEGPDQAARTFPWSYPEYEALRQTTFDFEDLAAFTGLSVNLTGGDAPAHVWGEVVSASYFGVLGVQATHGRTFSDDEDSVPGAHSVAMLSHEMWLMQSSGGAWDEGRTVRVNGTPMTVIGVLPPAFKGLTGRADVWVTQAMAPQVAYPGQLTSPQHFQNVVGRIKQARTLAEARAGLAAFDHVLDERFSSEHPVDFTWRATLQPLNTARIDPETRRSRLILFGAVFLVLLIAGTNLAGLLLGRGVARQREMVIRLALGSSRSRLVRQVLAESLVLGLVGGAGGVLLTLWLTRTAAPFIPDPLSAPRISDFASVSVDGAVVAFALTLSIVVGLAFGLGPALRAARPSADLSLRGGAPGDGFDRNPGARMPGPFSILVVSEFAMALTLVVGAALLVESLSNLAGRDHGFNAEPVVTFRIQPPSAQYAPEDGPLLLGRVLERLAVEPGVASVSMGPCAPLMTTCARRQVRLPPESGADPEWRPFRRHYVGPDHFRTLGIPLLRGRGLARDDRPGNPNVAVLNRHAAEALWPGQDPLGKTVVLEGGNFIGDDSTALVVGVVADVQYGPPDSPVGLDLYTSYQQFSWPFTYFMVRAEASATALIPALRRAVLEVDPDLPIYDVATMQDRRDTAMSGARFNSVLMASFAGLALLLAAMGIYGVMSQFVARRTRDMGVRIALGADRQRLMRLVLGRGLNLALAGVGVGTLGAVLLARVLASQLYGVSTTDPLAFATAAAFLLGVAVLAVYLPARHATRVDPVVVLRLD